MSGQPPLRLAVQQASLRPVPKRAQVRRWVAATLEAARAKRAAEIVVRFCDGAEARRLNRQFRARDYATNVLTFSEDYPDRIVADIVLCVPVLEKEARAQEKPVKNHTAHLVVHGVLHALGHDHASAREARRMEALETRILARFSVPDPYQVPA